MLKKKLKDNLAKAFAFAKTLDEGDVCVALLRNNLAHKVVVDLDALTYEAEHPVTADDVSNAELLISVLLDKHLNLEEELLISINHGGADGNIHVGSGKTSILTFSVKGENLTVNKPLTGWQDYGSLNTTVRALNHFESAVALLVKSLEEVNGTTLSSIVYHSKLWLSSPRKELNQHTLDLIYDIVAHHLTKVSQLDRVKLSVEYSSEDKSSYHLTAVLNDGTVISTK